MPAFLRDTAVGTATAAGAVSVVLPATVLGGDLLVMYVANSGVALASPPTNWRYLANEGTGSTANGAVLVARATGTRGQTSPMAGTTVTITTGGSFSWAAYVAVLGGASAVRRLGSNRVTGTSLLLKSDYAKGTALNLYFANGRLSTATFLPARGTVHHQTALANLAASFATEQCPVADAEVGFDLSPATSSSITATTLVAVSEFPNVQFHDDAFPLVAGGTVTTAATSDITRGVTLLVPTGTEGIIVTGVRFYVGASAQFGQAVTVGLWASTSAESPSVTATAIAQSAVGWQTVPVTPYTVPANTRFVATVYWPISPTPSMTNGGAPASNSYPRRAAHVDLESARTSGTGFFQPINPPSTSTTVDYLIDIVFTPATSMSVTGGGGAAVQPALPPDVRVSGGGGARVLHELKVSVSGGGEPGVLSVQEEYPAPEPEDLPTELIDPELYDEPPVLQTTFDMPEPTVVEDGVPVDWEPTED